MPERPAVAIVGAGITGLTCAAGLHGFAAVTVIDRIPVPGGVHGWEADETRDLVARCGAQLLLGSTATRWDGHELLVIDQRGATRLPVQALVVATGARPLGRAELGIAGGRPAGVVAATVACHLAENGLLVGRRPLVVGGGDWAFRACRELSAAGAEQVTLACPGGPLHPAQSGVRILEGALPVRVSGSPRVESVQLDSGEDVACDALVLAHGLAAVRNVDGAVRDAARAVFAQPLADPATLDAARTAGADAARAVRSLIEEER